MISKRYEKGSIILTSNKSFSKAHMFARTCARRCRKVTVERSIRGGTPQASRTWLILGDDGYLYFEGRRDDMFKRKGTRMSTIEIEAAAMDIPGIRAAAVLPPGDGHDLAILVEGDLAPHTVLRELAQRLEPAKVPAVCRVLPFFPLTLNGKNERKELVRFLDESP
ncbi:hypothetical protein ABZ297_11560 [Nonomuraea sp. NPDC005983]|uniref:hypothetical protein n=1 Tax=Nonomuraea sp. NPDC005983 TaxID=3155595 RepID=UPI0033AA048D